MNIRKTIYSIFLFTLFSFASISPVSAVCTSGATTCQDPRFWCTTTVCCDDLPECLEITNPPASGGGSAPTEGVSTFLDTLDTEIFNQGRPAGFDTPRGILSALLPLLFILGGMILFVMIVWGGFEMLTGAANPKSQEAGKQRITAAVIGFILLFASFWLAQLLELIFGISIL